MKTLFISDLHLDENHPKITQQFLWFLKQLNTSSIDALYILGDLFEAWVGDDDNANWHHEATQALQETSNKFPVYILHGNRDFLLGRRFAKKTGCIILPDETIINVYGQPVLLMHGDTLCTRDVAYLKARKKLRNPFIQTLFLLLPLSIRKKLAENMRSMSMQHTSNIPIELMDVTQSEVENKLRRHHVNYLIHGHTHQPGFHEFSLDETIVLRMVLGAWHSDGNVLVWDSSGKKEWLEFSSNSVI